MAETKAAAELAFDAFIESYTPKYEKAADCLSKDRDTLLAFYDFPAEHWKHLRTTNPIESTFATVRHRTIRSKGCLSNRTALAMVFKLLEAAQKSWRRLVPNPVVTGLSPVTPDDISKTWSRACIGRRRPGNTVGPFTPPSEINAPATRAANPEGLPAVDRSRPRCHRARPRDQPRAGYAMNSWPQKPRIIGSYRRETPILGETPIFGWTRWRPPKNQPPYVESHVGAVA